MELQNILYLFQTETLYSLCNHPMQASSVLFSISVNLTTLWISQKWNHIPCVSLVWLVSYNTMLGFIHVVHMASFYFLRLYYMPQFVYHPPFSRHIPLCKRLSTCLQTLLSLLWSICIEILLACMRILSLFFLRQGFSAQSLLFWNSLCCNMNSKMVF